MRRTLIILSICMGASCASAGCPTEATIDAFGHTFKRGGLAAMLSDDPKDCGANDQPAWIAKINEAAPSGASPKAASANALPPAVSYCREIARNKDTQYDSQRRDCIFWYGHSIEVQ